MIAFAISALGKRPNLKSHRLAFRCAKLLVQFDHEKRKNVQMAVQAKSIQIELASVRMDTVRSFALVVVNPLPAIGSASLAPKDAARTRLMIRIVKDAMRDMAKGIAAHSAILNRGQKSPNAISAVPI